MQTAATKKATPTRANRSFKKLLSDKFLIFFIRIPLSKK
jgi:hypothetical protein